MWELFDGLADGWRDAYDPPRVSWQTDALYHVEHARRMLKEARRCEAAAARQHARYEDEARARAIAAGLAQEARAAYWASPEGLAEIARWEEAAGKRQAALQRFGTYEKRNRWVYEQFLQGRQLKEIAVGAAVSRERVRQIVKKQARLDEAAKRREAAYWLRPNPGRVVDIDAAGGCGGPRDIWLTYRPPADPRLDNMEPVRVG